VADEIYVSVWELHDWRSRAGIALEEKVVQLTGLISYKSLEMFQAIYVTTS
jgi:hypothetical protein